MPSNEALIRYQYTDGFSARLLRAEVQIGADGEFAATLEFYVTEAAARRPVQYETTGTLPAAPLAAVEQLRQHPELGELAPTYDAGWDDLGEHRLTLRTPAGVTEITIVEPFGQKPSELDREVEQQLAIAKMALAGFVEQLFQQANSPAA